MKSGITLMILAGSAEARSLGTAAMHLGANVRALVSEPPRGANPLPMPCTLLSFNDVGSVQDHMRGCDAVLDASHGFDAAMTSIGHAAAQALGLPFLSYVRPKWSVQESVLWQSAASVTDAMPMIDRGARVFSATGWASVPECAAFPGERLLMRQTHEQSRRPPFGFIEFVRGDPPFNVVSETELFRKLNVDTLICRNLGGQPSRPKLDAARALDMKVILIDRPPLPANVNVVDTTDAALSWMQAL